MCERDPGHPSSRPGLQDEKRLRPICLSRNRTLSSAENQRIAHPSPAVHPAIAIRSAAMTPSIQRRGTLIFRDGKLWRACLTLTGAKILAWRLRRTHGR